MVHQVRGFSAPVHNLDVVNLYGEVALTVVDTEKVLSSADLTTPVFPSDSGELIQLQSLNNSDTDLVLVYGLGTDFKYQDELVKMNGTTPVQTTKTFTRVNRLDWTSKSAFLGEIAATSVGGGAAFRTLNVKAQLSIDAVYTIHADKTWQVDTIYSALTRDSNNTATGIVAVYYRPVGYAFRRPFKFPVASRGNSSNNYINLTPEIGPGPVDVYLTAEASDASVGTPTEIVARITMRMGQGA